MKKTFISILLAVCLVFAFMLAACGNGGGENPLPDNYTRPSDPNIDGSFTATGNTLVAYFSKTNSTKGVAEKIQKLTAADIFEIERKEPYPDAYTPTTELAREEKDNNARPELKVYLPDDVMESFDTVLLGFPIWWHTAPMAVLSFLNYYDLNGKTIYTFATSGGSSIGESTADIRTNAKGATVVEGKRFSGGNDSGIESWINSLNLIQKPVEPDEAEPNEPSNQSNIIIVYFTAERGDTERLAEYIHERVGGDIIKIEAAQPYTSQELNYSIKNNRPEVEKAENARPEIASAMYNAIDISKYDTVFIGYPIWWWTAPMIIGTFLEHYDLTEYDVYPFSQSASMNVAQFETSMEFVKNSAAVKGTPTVHDGLFARVSSTATINAYLTENGLIGR